MKQSRHIIEKRRNDIVELLHQSGQQQVQTLSEYFHTSPLTIRRDLIELEKQGVPRGVDLHRVRPLPYDPLALYALSVLVGTHGRGGDRILFVLL